MPFKLVVLAHFAALIEFKRQNPISYFWGFCVIQIVEEIAYLVDKTVSFITDVGCNNT
jgi:hypothetical protein